MTKTIKKNKRSAISYRSNAKKNDNILPHATLTRIYHQEGLRYNKNEAKIVQKKIKNWLRETGWIASLYSSHINNPAITVEDVQQSLAIQGIRVHLDQQLPTTRKKNTQTGGDVHPTVNIGTGSYPHLKPNDHNSICGQQCSPAHIAETTAQATNTDTSTSVEEVPAEESYCSLTKWPPETPQDMTMTGGGDAGLDGSVGSVGDSSVGDGSAGGGKTPHPLGHVQVSVSLDVKDDFSGQCTHELTAEENIINNKTYPLHKYESLYDGNSLDLHPPDTLSGSEQSGGGSASGNGYSIPHQNTIPVNIIQSNIDDLGDWNTDTIQILRQALEFKLRILIHKVHYQQFTNTGSHVTRQLKKKKTSSASTTKKTYKKKFY